MAKMKFIFRKILVYYIRKVGGGGGVTIMVTFCKTNYSAFSISIWKIVYVLELYVWFFALLNLFSGGGAGLGGCKTVAKVSQHFNRYILLCFSWIRCQGWLCNTHQPPIFIHATWYHFCRNYHPLLRKAYSSEYCGFQIIKILILNNLGKLRYSWKL